jgi:hypothetical protein
MPWHDMKFSAIPDASHRLWILADHAQGAWALERRAEFLRFHVKGQLRLIFGPIFSQRCSRAARHKMNSSNSFLRASTEAIDICRRSATNRSKSAFKCLALIRRGRSAALPLSATSIAKANPVTRDPTHLRATNVGTFPNIVSIEKMRG